MKHLRQIFDSPRDVLDKLKSDGATLIETLNASDETGVRRALFNFTVTAHSLFDWVLSFRPELEQDVCVGRETFVYGRVCRDLGNAAKHGGLDLERAEYKKHPAATQDLAFSAPPASSISFESDPPKYVVNMVAAPTWQLKIILKSGERVSARQFVATVIQQWEEFFDAHAL